MTFENSIKDIVNSIKQREFLNEAEISNGVVLRVLNELGWNVYDTKRVKPQYRIENKMIDFALCFPENKPIIIIEVKALGKAVNTDEQVLTYAFKTGIPVAILTDGQEWHFYLPAERGSLTERRFYKLDLLEREAKEVVEILQGYLGYEEIRSGAALQKARADYEKQYKSKEIDEAIPKAWDKLLKDRDSLFIKLISEKVADICGFEPSNDVVIAFLEKLNPTTLPLFTNQPTKEYTPRNISIDNTEVIIPKLSDPSFHGVKFNNQEFKTKKGIGVLQQLLKIVVTEFPNSLSRIETQTKGNSRFLISKQKSQLYKNRPDLVEKYSKELPNNWWLGTNYSVREMEIFCDIIVNSINREYGNQNITWKL